MPLKLAAVSSVILAAWCGVARAQCADVRAPAVELDAAEPELTPLSAALRAGLARSGIAVCAGEPAAQRVARVEVNRESPDAASWRIRVRDDVTHKSVERSIALGSMPEDSRAIALAVYVEELLQASWAELALSQRTFLEEQASVTPAAVQRELARATPARMAPQPTAANEPLARGPLRVFGGGLAAAHGGGLIQAGVELGLALKLAPTLDAGVRGAFLQSPSVRTSHGRIEALAGAAGVFLEPVLQVTPALALRLPQALDVQRVSFRPRPDRGAGGRTATRAAVVVSHGVGPSIAFTPQLALTLVARLCWALLPARAADDGVLATGISGLGGQIEVLFDATL